MEKAFVFAHQRANGFSSLEASLAQPTAKVSSLVCWFVCSFLRFLLPHLPSLLLDSIVELCFLRRGRSSCRYFYGSTMLHLAFRLVMNNWVLSYFYSSILPFLCALLSRNDSTVKNLKKALIQIIVGDSKKEKAAPHKTCELQAFLQILCDRTWAKALKNMWNVIGNNQKNFHFWRRRIRRRGVECHDNSGNVTCFTDPFILFSLLFSPSERNYRWVSSVIGSWVMNRVLIEIPTTVLTEEGGRLKKEKEWEKK